MNNLKSFVAGVPLFNLVGGVGQGGPMDDFHKAWKYRQTGVRTWLVGRRDGANGCFSMQPMSGGVWDIAWYEFEGPALVMKYLDSPKDYPEIAANAVYFQSEPSNKYLALDLLHFMSQLEDWRKDHPWVNE